MSLNSIKEDNFNKENIINTLNQEISKFKIENNELIIKNKELIANYKSTNINCESIKLKLNTTNDKLIEYIKQFQEIELKYVKEKQTNDNLLNAVNDTDSELINLKNEYNKNINEFQRLDFLNKNLKQENKELKNIIASCNKKIVEKDKRLEEMSYIIKNSEESAKILIFNEKFSKDKIENLIEDNTKINKEVIELKKVIKILKTYNEKLCKELEYVVESDSIINSKILHI